MTLLMLFSSATFTPVVPPANTAGTRTYAVPVQSRSAAVVFDRTYRIPAQNRTYKVLAS